MVSCSNCRESHTACDSGRPCKRCVSTGRAHTCRDAAVRKRGRKPVSFSMDGSHISIDPLTNVTSTPSFSFSPATPSQPTFPTTNKNLAVHNKNFTPQPPPPPQPQPQPSFHHYPPFTPSPSSSSSSYEGRRAQPKRGKEERLQGKEREADYEEQQPPPEQSFSSAASSSAPPPFGPYCCCGNCHGTTNNERGGRFNKRNKRAASFEGEEEEEDEEEHHLLAAIRAMMKTHMEEIRNDMDGLRGLLLKTQTDIDALRQTISPPTAKYSPHSSSYSSYSPSSLNAETSSPHSSSIINYPASSSSSSVTVDVCCSTSPPPSPLSLLYSSSFNIHNNNNFPSYSCDIPLPFPFSPPQPHQQSAFPPYLPTLTDSSSSTSSSSSSSSSLSSASAIFTSNRHTLPGWVLVVQQRIRQKPFAIVKAEFSQTDNAIVSLNRAFCSIFGKHPEDLIDTPASFIRKLLTRSNNADAKLHIEKVDFTKKPDSHELKFSISISPHPSSSASAQQHMVLAMNILVQRFLDEGGAPQWTILTVEEKTLRPVHPPPSGSPIFSAVDEPQQPSLSSSYFAPPPVQMYSSPSSSSSSSPLFSSSSSSDPSSYSSSPLMTMMEEQEQVQQTATPSASIPTSASVEDLLYLANNYSSTMSSAASSVFDVSFHPLIPPSPPPSTSFLHPEE